MWMSILGRQPELSLAELEARFGAAKVKLLRPDVALIEAEQIDIQLLGGSQKTARLIGEASSVKSSALPRQLLAHLPPSGSKQNVGVSVYGDLSAREAGHIALTLKKLAKPAGHKLRIIPNNEPALSTAQVMHNQLAEADNCEFILAVAGSKTYLGQTIGVQDIDAYRRRDVERPARDARVGMLPPKLSQIMLNLARVQPGQTVLDPFCGTGVVLQEALLMGARVCGSDISERMVRMSETNLLELGRHYPDMSAQERIHLEVADARSWQWPPPIDAVVTEMYLGPAFAQTPDAAQLDRAAKEVDGLLNDTLVNLRPQLASGARLVLAVPRWQNPSGRTLLPSLDRLEELGYNSTRFVHAPGDLVYARDDQIVGRQLLVLSKI